MCDDTGYEIEREKADILWKTITDRTAAVITILRTQYCKDDGGNIIYAQAKRGREQVFLSLFLGEYGSNIGPYDDLCYVGLRERRWWWQKWSPLMCEIDLLVKSLVVTSGDSTACR